MCIVKMITRYKLLHRGIGFYINVFYKDSTKNALVTNNGDTHVINNAMSLDPGNKFHTWCVTMISSVAS